MRATTRVPHKDLAEHPSTPPPPNPHPLQAQEVLGVHPLLRQRAQRLAVLLRAARRWGIPRACGAAAGASHQRGRQLLQALTQSLLKLLAAAAEPAVHHEDVQGVVVARVEGVRLAYVQPDVAQALAEPAEQFGLVDGGDGHLVEDGGGRQAGVHVAGGLRLHPLLRLQHQGLEVG